MLNADHQTMNILINAFCGVAILLSIYALFRAFTYNTKFRKR
jgi:hypothetical protein